MSLIATSNHGQSVPILDAGTYQAVCCGVVDIGRQYDAKWKNTKAKIIVFWDIVGETVEIDGKSLPRRMSKTYTNSTDSKSNLTSDLNAWRGKPFTDEERAGFDTRNLLNVGCQISIVHVKRVDQASGSERTYANVAAVIGLPKGLKLEPMSEPFFYDLDAPDEAVFAALPEWVQKRIMQSEEWVAAHSEKLPFDEAPPAEDGADTIAGEYGDGELPF